MKDTRFQLILDDIDAAIASRKAADAAIDDARTKLADMVEEGLPPHLLVLANRASMQLNYGIRNSIDSRQYSATHVRFIESARATINRAIERQL